MKNSLNKLFNIEDHPPYLPDCAMVKSGAAVNRRALTENEQQIDRQFEKNKC